MAWISFTFVHGLNLEVDRSVCCDNRRRGVFTTSTMRVHATDRRNATGAPWMAVATALRLAALVATLNASGTTAGGSRRVSWFTSGGAWPIGTDGLNLSQWITAHRGAITGTMPCCGCWAALKSVRPLALAVRPPARMAQRIWHTELANQCSAGRSLLFYPVFHSVVCFGTSHCALANIGTPLTACVWINRSNGTFVNTGRCSSKTGYTPDGDPVRAAVHRANWAAAANAGVTLEPTGGFSVGFILNGSWMQPGSLDSLVQMLQTEGWDGIGLCPLTPSLQNSLRLCASDHLSNPTMACDLSRIFFLVPRNEVNVVCGANAARVKASLHRGA